MPNQLITLKPSQIANGKTLGKNIGLFVFVAMFGLLFSEQAMAAKDLVGGINSAKSIVDSAITAIMAFVGIVAGGYLLWKALDAWQGRSDWKEFGMSVVYVAIAGGSVMLATWAWTFFTT